MATSGKDGATCNILEKMQKELLGVSEKQCELSVENVSSNNPSDVVKDNISSNPARGNINEEHINNGSSPARENQYDDDDVILEENTASDREILMSLFAMQKKYMAKVDVCVNSVKELQDEWSSYQEPWNGEMQDEDRANYSVRGDMGPSATAGRQDGSRSWEREGGEKVSAPLDVTSPVMAAPGPSGINKSVESPQRSVIEQLAERYKVPEKSGPPVDKGVADLIDGLISTRLEEKQRTELFEKHVCPSNVLKLKPPRVNAGIWQIMNLETRQRDTKSQKMQEILLHGLVPLTRAVDKLNTLLSQSSPEAELNQSLSSIIEHLGDGMALISSGSYELSIKRRDAIRQDLSSEYKQLCAHSNPITEFLFGDDLSEKVKDLSERNKLISKLSSPGRQMFMRGRGRVSPRGRGFRGMGRGDSFLENPGQFPNPNRFNPYTFKTNTQQASRGSPSRGRRARRM